MSQRAYKLYLVYCGATSAFFWLVFTISSLYEVSVARLDPLQLVLVGTTLELSVFLFEIPTGVVADLYSRRTSIWIGLFLIGAGFLLEGAWPLFGPILLAQVLWGVGYTFTSGALQAWITDEIGEEQAGLAFVRGAQWEQAGALLGTLLSTALASLAALNLPILLSGTFFILFGLVLIVQMPESGFHPAQRSDTPTWTRFFETLRSGAQVVRARPSLTRILGAGLFLGLYSEGLDRLWVAHLLERFTFPWFSVIVWMGILQAVGMGLNVIAAEVLQRRVNLNQRRTVLKTMSGASALVLVFLVCFALSENLLLSLCAFLATRVLRTLISPLYTAWVNQDLDSQVRATVLSMSSQVDALGQISGGPLVGWVARQFSIQIGLLSSSLLLSPALALFARQMKEERG